MESKLLRLAQPPSMPVHYAEVQSIAVTNFRHRATAIAQLLLAAPGMTPQMRSVDGAILGKCCSW